MLLLRLHDKDQ